MKTIDPESIQAIKDQLLMEISSVSDHMGIYPQAVMGFGKEAYGQRDGFKNGWSACVIEFVQAVENRIGTYEEPWASPARLFSAADGWFYKNGDEWSVNTSDSFYYACSDAELIPKEEMESVANLFLRWGFAGALYWVSQKRGGLPTIPKWKRQVILVSDCIEVEESEAKSK